MSSVSTLSPERSQSGPVRYANLSVAELVEHAIRNGEAVLSDAGALVAETGKYTGRVPKFKTVVREPGSEKNIWWSNNQEMSAETFSRLDEKAERLASQRPMYIIDAFGGADPEHRIAVRFRVEKAWHALFVKQLLIRPTAQELETFKPDWTVTDLGTVTLDPAKDGTVGEASVSLSFDRKKVIIFGTQYAGEMKKSVFTVLNYLLPMKGVLAIHCSANIGPTGDTALFFGLSGTGKTTLSADPERRLIGDDEHGWTERGVFNFEGGCYAKCIKLNPNSEPQIFGAVRFGAVLENVVLRGDRSPDYEDASKTENTRVAYPLGHIANAVEPSVGGHPKNIVFLTADAFGVLPPISKLTSEQAMYYYLNGYTAKVAGTEAGVTEPQATFSTCFGAPFLPLPPARYAELLKERIEQHGARVWLINTGWSGGSYGVGSRIKLDYTRAMIHAAFSGALDRVEYVTHPVFNLQMPTSCPEVPSEILDPRAGWKDKDAYDAQARELKAMFEENSKKYAEGSGEG